jgi:O-antigen ligase
VLLLWTFLPLLQQLQSGAIRRWRGFWWPVCVAVPLLCLLQIGLSQGDGAFLAAALGTAMVGRQAWRGGGERRRLFGTELVLLLAALGTVLVGGASFFTDAVQRNSNELVQGTQDSMRRLLNWQIYAQAFLASPLWGVGIQAVPAGSGL